MLTSVDGKITTGSTNNLDFDKDLPTVVGVREGLQQYYDIEQTTDLWSLCSGRVQDKMGVNQADTPKKTRVNFVLIDNHHLTLDGVNYFINLSEKFVLITSNREHPAFSINSSNLHIYFEPILNFHNAFEYLYEMFGCEKMTVQTGGTLNSILFKEKLIDAIDIVIAPVIIGGKETSSLVDGILFTQISDLKHIPALKLTSINQLENSYIRLKYKVVK